MYWRNFAWSSWRLRKRDSSEYEVTRFQICSFLMIPHCCVGTYKEDFMKMKVISARRGLPTSCNKQLKDWSHTLHSRWRRPGGSKMFSVSQLHVRCSLQVWQGWWQRISGRQWLRICSPSGRAEKSQTAWGWDFVGYCFLSCNVWKWSLEFH